LQRVALLALSFSFSLSVADASEKGLISRYFKKIPVSEAHTTYGSARNRELNADSIKVLVWNIKKAQEKAWKREFSEYAQGKDIFLIQEAYDVPRFLETIGSYEGYRWDMGKSFTYRLYNNSTGTMVASHAEPEDVLVTHTPDHEPVTNTPKAMTFAKYPLDRLNQSLLVISIHAINFRELGPFKRNLLQAREHIEQHNGPVIFAGDFNTHLGDRTRYLKNMMQELRFTEVTFSNGHQRMRAPVTRNFLDHGFVRDLSVKEAKVIGESRGSDHRPMVLELSLELR
jgi:endonuclease/exonuclease/phosphatase (EEP) superfamily protein YafD